MSAAAASSPRFCAPLVGHHSWAFVWPALTGTLRNRGAAVTDTAHLLHTKAGLDIEVSGFPYDRRLSMTVRRAADLFDCVSMFSTASLMRELAHAANFEVSASTAFLEAEME